MEKLDRNPLAVLDAIAAQADLIYDVLPRAGVSTALLQDALVDIRWLNFKSVWFKGQGYIQERLGFLGEHLQALALEGEDSTRRAQLQCCVAEIGRLRMPMAFGQFAAAEFVNRL